MMNRTSPYPPGTDPLLAATVDAERAAGYIKTETPPTAEDYAAVKPLSEHHAAVQANPIAKAAFERTTAKIEARTHVLREIRQARALTQVEIGELLGMTQSDVSKLEGRADLLLSTLRRYVAATGGELQLTVTYPDSDPMPLTFEHLTTTG
jgi:predicted XRE-type DNA-binding protein